MTVGGAGLLRGFILSPILIFAFSLVEVRWTTPAQNAIQVAVPDRAAGVQGCLEDSLKARLRFEVRVCRKRSGWVDRCEEPRAELHTVTYDEVTESYRVVSDRLDDEQEPIAIEVPSRAEAVRLVTTLENLPLKFLTPLEPELLNHAGAYVQIRTVFTCRGNSSRPFTHISRILTFGLLNNVEDRSSWEDFALHDSVEAAR
jgi:hypothetical protein